MKQLLYVLASAMIFTGCANLIISENQLQVELKGEMLFSGPNSLTADVTNAMASMTKELGLAEEDIVSIGVSGISITLMEEQAVITESLLLQVVSNNHEMTSLGTLSPLPGGTTFELQVAEEIDLLPILKDEGATWVLDVNLTEDVMDLMVASTAITLSINHKEE